MKEEGSWGFDQYDITWSNRKKNFSLFAFKSEFFGFYRRDDTSDGDDHHIEIFVRVKERKPLGEHKHSLGVVSIPYEEDPRDDMRSLRSDICAAVNQWHYQRCSHGVMYEDLIKHLDNPTMTINRVDDLLSISAKIEHLLNVGGKDVIKINNTSIIIDVPQSNQVRLPIYKASPKSKVTPEKWVDMIQAVMKFDASGDTDAKKLRKKIRRLGWEGGLRKLREAIESENVPH